MITESSIKVAVKSRPLNSKELNEGCLSCVSFPEKMGHEVILGGSTSISLDYAFSEDITQAELYEKSCKNMISNLFSGYNVTILAYGQTGSGKTYTMGTSYTDNVITENSGIIPRAIVDIYKYIDEIKDNSAVSITVTFLEVYNEEIFDLLSETKEIRVVREENQDIKIPNLTEVTVNNIYEIYSCLEKGSENRSTGSTAMNSTSSRSHALFSIHLSIMPNGEGDIEPVFAKLQLVDLAGSERASKTHATGNTLKEGCNINKGLSHLGNVISALVEREQTRNRSNIHVPYRNSKLTRLLQDSLGGNTKTLMMTCISPSDSNFKETSNTLQYAARARQIKNRPVMNKVDSSQGEIYQLRAQVSALTAQLRKYEAGETPTSTTDNLYNPILNSYIAQTLKKDVEISHLLQQKEDFKNREYALINELNKRNEILKQLLDSNIENIDRDEIEMLVGNNEWNQDNSEHPNLEEDMDVDEESTRPETNVESDSLLDGLKEDLQSKTNILQAVEKELNLMKCYEDKIRELESKIGHLEEEKRNNKHKNNHEVDFKLSEYRKQMNELNYLKKEKERKTEEVCNLKEKINDLKYRIVRAEKDIKAQSKQFALEIRQKTKEINNNERQNQKKIDALRKDNLKKCQELSSMKRKFEKSQAAGKRMEAVFDLNKRNIISKISKSGNVHLKVKNWIRQTLDEYSSRHLNNQKYDKLQERRCVLTNQLRNLDMTTSLMEDPSKSEHLQIQNEINQINGEIRELQKKQIEQLNIEEDSLQYANGKDLMIVSKLGFQENQVAMKLLFANLIKERNNADLIMVQLNDTREQLDNCTMNNKRLFREYELLHQEYSKLSESNQEQQLGKNITDTTNLPQATNRPKRKTQLDNDMSNAKKMRAEDFISDTESVTSRRSTQGGFRVCKCKSICRPARCGCYKKKQMCDSKCGCKGACVQLRQSIESNISSNFKPIQEESEGDEDQTHTSNFSGDNNSSGSNTLLDDKDKENRIDETFVMSPDASEKNKYEPNTTFVNINNSKFESMSNMGE